MRILLPFFLVLTSCGPATVQGPPAPQQQTADAQIADWLLTAQNGIEAATKMVPMYPGLKDPLNRLIAAYDAAESSYLAYHAALAKGGTTDAAALTAQVQQLLASVTALQGLYK